MDGKSAGSDLLWFVSLKAKAKACGGVGRRVRLFVRVDVLHIDRFDKNKMRTVVLHLCDELERSGICQQSRPYGSDLY